MTYKTKEELAQAIEETFRQEHLFRLANDRGTCAYWILERVKLRGQLINLICGGLIHGE